jgi:hypothetical protein
MRRLITAWRHLKSEDRDYIGVYMWGALWIIWFMVFTPAPITGLVFRGTIILFGLVALAGVILAVRGVLVSDHLITEKYGVLLIMAGPFSYTLLQAGQTVVDLVTLGETQRSHLIIFGAWPLFWLLKRYRHLSRQVGEAKATPLPEEEA